MTTAVPSRWRRMVRTLTPIGIESQLIVLLAAVFVSLLALLALLESRSQNSVAQWATSQHSIDRIQRILRVVPFLADGALADYVSQISRCHEGYTLTSRPYGPLHPGDDAIDMASLIAAALGLPADEVTVGYAMLAAPDFSYGSCAQGDISLPVEGIVVSIRLAEGRWLNAEIHPHEWHLTPTMTSWLMRSGAAFVLVGFVTLLVVRRIVRPLHAMTAAARSFGQELRVAELDETGPQDIRRTIQAFNRMQEKIADGLRRRVATLAAVSHDIRSPLTALRLKSELLADQTVRGDLLDSVAKMERITESALAYLHGESPTEPMKSVHLCSLVESEIADLVDSGGSIQFRCQEELTIVCRPDAIARAVRNLIENALKYAGAASVSVALTGSTLVIAVADNGPGIAASDRQRATDPFERLSDARESRDGGFGLGLAIVDSVARGHGGELILRSNQPTGLIAEICIPVTG